MTTILRPLSTSELLDRTFHLYRNNFLIFVGISAIPQLSILPLTLGGAAMMARHQTSAATAMLFAGYLIYVLAVFFAQVATVSAVSSLHLERAISIGGSYSSSWRSFPRVVWIVFLISIIAGALFFTFSIVIALVGGLVAAAELGPWIAGIGVITAIVVPGYLIVRWMLTWSLVIPVTVLEGGWFLTSIRRSRFLVKNSRWGIFVIYFLMGVLGGVTTIMMQSILLLLVPLFGINDYQGVEAATAAIEAIGIFASTTLVGALGMIAICLFYYDQRVRKEGLDLQLMVATLERAPQNPAAASAL
jgi:hypothetical protein